MLKMYTKNQKWIVVDGERKIEFNTSREAWEFIFVMRGMRPNPKAQRSLNPVTTLSPSPIRKKKKIFVTVS